MIGLRYAALMEDFDKIQEEILNCDINSNKEATKIYSIPNRLGLPNATLLKNKIASKYGKFTLHFLKKPPKIIFLPSETTIGDE